MRLQKQGRKAARSIWRSEIEEGNLVDRQGKYVMQATGWIMDKLAHLPQAISEEVSTRSQGISISLLVLLLVQTGGIVWWGATITANLSNLNANVLYRVDREEQERKRLEEVINARLRSIEGEQKVQYELWRDTRERLIKTGALK